jgi:uncharacterized protein (DUF885 family)
MRHLVWIPLVAACSSSKPAPSAPAPAASAVTAIADEIVAFYIGAYPNQAALSGLPGVPDDGYEDNSLAALAAAQAREDEWAKRLDAIDGDALWGTPDWITYGFTRAFVDGSRATRVCRNELWPINHMSGWTFQLIPLGEAQRVGTPELREKALARWRLVPRYVDNEIANAREGLRLGYSTPRGNVDLVIQQLDDLLKLPPDKSPFWGPPTRDPALVPAWTELLRDHIYPAMKRQRDFLASEYRDRARESFAISANPDGAACYAAAFTAMTTIQRTPDETFALGSTTVAGNLAEATAIAKASLGIAELPQIVARLRTDPKNRFQSRDELLAFTRAAVERAKAAMSQAFSVLPKADVVIEPYPTFLEASASDSYQGAPVDGSRPAKYRINLGGADEATRGSAEVTAFHETYPGHHLQIAIGREQPERHPITILVGNTAFHEGWARYAEALAEELGLYGSDYGKIQRRLWPARGMVADPGLHLKGWTPAQTIAYLKEAGRFTDKEIEALINRMAAWPAQLTAYDTGGLEFRALRKQAQAALGDRFDLREFHRVILENGAVTFPMLHKIVDRWIADQTAAR